MDTVAATGLRLTPLATYWARDFFMAQPIWVESQSATRFPALPDSLANTDRDVSAVPLLRDRCQSGPFFFFRIQSSRVAIVRSSSFHALTDEETRNLRS